MPEPKVVTTTQVVLPRRAVERAARALCQRVCCDDLGILRGHEDYCLVPLLVERAARALEDGPL